MHPPDLWSLTSIHDRAAVRTSCSTTSKSASRLVATHGLGEYHTGAVHYPMWSEQNPGHFVATQPTHRLSGCCIRCWPTRFQERGGREMSKLPSSSTSSSSLIFAVTHRRHFFSGEVFHGRRFRCSFLQLVSRSRINVVILPLLFPICQKDL